MATCDRRMFRNDSGSDDRGIAMFAVLMICAIAGWLAAGAYTAASGTLRRSDRGESREQALHLADAAVARAFTALAADAGYSTTTDAPPTPATRDWVLEEAATSPLEQAREGEYAWVVPAGSDIVFGVGFVPSRAQPVVTRVVEVDASVVRPLGMFSIVAAGSLLLDGNPTVEGGVHSNGNLSINGDPTITGDATASGTYTVSGQPEVTGATGGGFDPLPVPAADPRAYRDRATVDLCPDGTVRTVIIEAPCTGTQIGSGSGSGYQGWTFSTSKWRASGNNVGSGVFYVYHSSVKLTGSLGPWNATILIEGQVLNGQLVNGDLEVSGNIELIGDVQVEGSTEAIAFVVSRDIKITGNGFFDGLIHAGEQISISGNSEIAGQVLAAGTADTPGSLVSANVVAGNSTVSDEDDSPNSSPSVDASRWTEL